MAEEDGLGDMFEEPTGYFQAEKPHTFADYTTDSGEKLSLRLVGHSPLWGHLLWNAGQTIAHFLEENRAEYITGKYVLEFGAGAGLPSIIAALNGAAQVVVTDYPDQDLVENLRYNVEKCCISKNRNTIATEGFLWGAETNKLKSHLPESDRQAGFHTLILADLLFNHSEHQKLAKSVSDTLRREPPGCSALVFFTPYRPWLYDKDMDFFRVVQEHGLTVEKILEKELEKLLFENDPGPEKPRRTVYGYKLTWPDS